MNKQFSLDAWYRHATDPFIAMEELALHGAELHVDQDSLDACSRSRDLLHRLESEGQHIYGVTTGFGAQGTVDIPVEDRKALQEELIRFHHVGVGPVLSPIEGRAVFIARILSLARGVSGVRPELIVHMVTLLNAGVAPVIPSRGSVGASGDLTPLSHLAAGLCGWGELYYEGVRQPADGVLEHLAMEPWTLDIKEGLALINGTAVMTGLLAVSVPEIRSLAQWVDRISALGASAMGYPQEPFDPWVHTIKGHRGSVESAKAIVDEANLDSEPISQQARRGNIQPPYSFRCVPQINGVLRDSLGALEPWIRTELASANDNPLFDSELGRVYHSGNFYGGHMATAGDFLRISLANSMFVIDRQVQQLLLGSEIIPPNCAKTSRFGLKALGITTTALAAEIQSLAQPASLLTRPTESGNQDQVSMGTTGALKLREMLNWAWSMVAHGFAVASRARSLAEQEPRDWEQLVLDRCPELKEEHLQGKDLEKLRHLLQAKLV